MTSDKKLLRPGKLLARYPCSKSIMQFQGLGFVDSNHRDEVDDD